MGRKIPGKKHRGVKDPEQQKKDREDKVKKQGPQVNAGPAVIDHQDMPKKLLRLMKEKETWKEMDMRRKEAKALKKKAKEEGDSDLLDSAKSAIVENRLPGMKRPLKPIPVFRQNPGESQKRFFNRMEKTAKAVIERSKYEDKYGVEVKQDEVTGKTSVKEKEKRMKKKRRLRKKLMTEDGEWQEERAKDFEDLDGDDVSFNEVAMQPPTLKSAAKMRKVTKGDDDDGASKGGKNTKLLLSKKLKKKPQISLARKQILESERQRVIQEYRNLKLGGRVSKADLRMKL